MLAGLGQQQLGDFLQGVQQTSFLNGDDRLRSQRLEEVAVLLAESAHQGTFQVEHALQAAAGADQRDGQLGAHLQVGVQRIIDVDPRLGAQVGDAHAAGDAWPPSP